MESIIDLRQLIQVVTLIYCIEYVLFDIFSLMYFVVTRHDERRAYLCTLLPQSSQSENGNFFSRSGTQREGCRGQCLVPALIQYIADISVATPNNKGRYKTCPYVMTTKHQYLMADTQVCPYDHHRNTLVYTPSTLSVFALLKMPHCTIPLLLRGQKNVGVVRVLLRTEQE